MKKFSSLCIALATHALFGAPFASADKPSSDPVVRGLRERFKLARVPTADDLAYGKSWVCDYYSAVAGSHEHDRFGYFFDFRATNVPLLVENHDSFQAPRFYFSGHSLIGNYYNGDKVYSADRVRVGPAGELLVEVTLPECSGLSCLVFGWVQDRAVDDYWAAIVGYRVCHVEE